MPFYEYQCTNCGHKLEVLQKISDQPLIQCPVCEMATLKKLVTAAAFRLKGSGWYETDFKNSGKEKSDKSVKDTPEPAKTESGKDSSDKPAKPAESATSAA
ncbi:MAG: zinc ribbon domain-containing protein [Gammaproteobacteria bacterium]|nr:zinc ribbon domain-containing protein [Gammaproteobacteria bacterium]MCY4226541.1 zinc ribbon domain-containing protein [Gammaproteobacteria bacterium]MCY4312563.1 zinc ribbon domain-containing protein [Gammaproteobacteria bacterium]